MLSALLTGALIGWLAGNIMDTRKSGLIRNILVGSIGSSLGSFLFGLVGFTAYGMLAELIVSVSGACIFIWLMRKLF
ncbi:MAG: GlsB/YeaQ/YmgE family stress response membrane protein [Clostridia bacterium]|nr:GlsB/YeaQ/YmgE family stress response membrane protein [Clostridia bacterium]